jgi:membrane-associated protease RseP (regulator of RpoE activity)
MKRSEMNSSGTQTMGRRLPLAFLVLLAAAPASAQSDTVRVRTVSTWQKDVDQLRMELLEKRRMETELVRMLNTLERRRVLSADSQRTNLRVESQFVVNRLRETVEDQGRLRRQLESMCADVRKPEGWLGVATTGFQLLDRQENGPQIIRFLETPVVASVDPGSPAERVGLRAGDELMEIGGKRLLNANVIFAELLKPGEKIVVKLRRGNEVITVQPRIEPTPQVSVGPCTWVDGFTAYVVSPATGQMRVNEIIPATGGAGMAYTYTTRDSAGSVATGVLRRQSSPTNTVVASPMPRMFGSVGSSLAGLELMALNPESGRAFGVTYGLFVNQVLPGTPGRESGLQGGDVLVTADSMALSSVASLQRVINRARDRVVTLTVLRRGKTETVQLKW